MEWKAVECAVEAIEYTESKARQPCLPGEEEKCIT